MQCRGQSDIAHRMSRHPLPTSIAILSGVQINFLLFLVKLRDSSLRFRLSSEFSSRWASPQLLALKFSRFLVFEVKVSLVTIFANRTSPLRLQRDRFAGCSDTLQLEAAKRAQRPLSEATVHTPAFGGYVTLYSEGVDVST